MGVEHAGDGGLVACEYELNPDDPDLEHADPLRFETIDVDDYNLAAHLDIDERLLKSTDENTSEDTNENTETLVWQCRRLTEPDADGKSLCPFHRDPADREISDAFLSQLCLDLVQDEREESDLVDEYIEKHVSDGIENADEALKIKPQDGEQLHGEAVARRRKMFCGAKFGRFDLSRRVFGTPDRYPIDLQGAVVEELDWSEAVVDSPIRANGMRAPIPDAPRKSTPPESGNVRFSGAEIRGELSLSGLATEGKVSLSETALRDVQLDDAVIGGDELSVRAATIDGKLTATELQTTGRVLALRTEVDTRLSLSNAEMARLRVSQSDIKHGLSLHEVRVRGELDVTQSSLGGRCSMHNATIDEEASFYATRVDGDLVFNDATLRGESRLQDVVINGNIIFVDAILRRELKLEDAVIEGELKLEETPVGGSLPLGGITVAEDITFENSPIDGDVPLANATVGGCITFEGLTIHGDLSLESAAVEGKVSMPASLAISGGLRCEAANIHSLDLDGPQTGGAIDLTRLEADTLRVTPPTMENRHPAIRAVILRECRIGTAALAPLATPANTAEPSTPRRMTDTVVYDLEGGSVETLEQLDGSVPRGKSLYDYLRLVKTDFTDVDFSVHRDRLFQNQWNLHGLREGGEDDVQLARRFDDIRKFLNDTEQDAGDVPLKQRELRRLAEVWCDRTGDSPNRELNEQHSIEPYDDEVPQSPTETQDGVEAVIASSRVLSALDTVVSATSRGRTWLRARVSKGIVEHPGRPPSTLTLDQLESTYAGAKSAADAMGENEAASAFFVREQWYVQLQNRRHIREEFPPVYQRAVGAIGRVVQRGRDILSKLSSSGSHGPEPDIQRSAPERRDATARGPADEGEDVPANESTDQSHPKNDIEPDGGQVATGGTLNDTDSELSNLPAKPRKLLRYLLAWVSNAFLRVFTRYGESPRRVLGWWLGIIAAWFGLYYLVALARLGWTAPWQLLIEQGLGFLLLSIGSFTTVIPALPVLPFGDDVPSDYAFLRDDWVITLFSEVEGLLGVLFISLFVLTLTRSIQR